jgi:hypothetical protein
LDHPPVLIDLGAHMRIAVVTFEGFNELDSFIASAMINRVKQPELKAVVVCPSERITSISERPS